MLQAKRWKLIFLRRSLSDRKRKLWPCSNWITSARGRHRWRSFLDYKAESGRQVSARCSRPHSPSSSPRRVESSIGYWLASKRSDDYWCRYEETQTVSCSLFFSWFPLTGVNSTWWLSFVRMAASSSTYINFGLHSLLLIHPLFNSSRFPCK